MTEFARDVAKKHVNAFVAGGALVALTPIPGSTTVALTAFEGKLATDLAGIYGLRLTGVVGSVILKALLLGAGGGVLLKGVAESLTFVPVFGWFAKPGVAGATVAMMGDAMIRLLEARFPDQRAYQTPSWLGMLTAFGGSVALGELQTYYRGLSSVRHHPGGITTALANANQIVVKLP